MSNPVRNRDRLSRNLSLRSDGPEWVTSTHRGCLAGMGQAGDEACIRQHRETSLGHIIESTPIVKLRLWEDLTDRGPCIDAHTRTQLGLGEVEHLGLAGCKTSIAFTGYCGICRLDNIA